MLQTESAPQSTERKQRIRKKKHSPLFWILRILMVVSFCCFLVFLAMLVVPKIQAMSVRNRIPVPGTSNFIAQTQANPIPAPEAADSSAAPEDADKTEDIEEDEPDTKIGDVNEDGNIDISDIVAVINQIAGTATYRFADVNNDKKVDISDIVAIINTIAGQ